MRRLAAFVIGVVLLSSGTALAQMKGDVSGGYRYIHADEENFAKGWYFDVAGHVTDVVSIVGDVGGTYKSESLTEGGVTFDANLKIHIFQAGARFRAPMVNPNVVPFGQVLFGGAKSTIKFSAAGISDSDSETDGVMSVGGGVDVTGGSKVGVRVMAGWLRVFEEGDATNAFSFSVGARIGF